MADDKKSKALLKAYTTASKVDKVVALSKSKIPDYKFTPPPPVVKTKKED
jgi:hypothetical protein